MEDISALKFFTELQTQQQKSNGGLKWNTIITDIISLYISCVPTKNQEISEERLWSFLFDVHTTFATHYEAYTDVYLFLLSSKCSSVIRVLYTALSDPPKEWWITNSSTRN